MDEYLVQKAVRKVIREELDLGHAPIARKWEGGTIEFHPNTPDLQSKEVPINVFFKKIVMVRDKLRVLEAKVNADPDLLPGRKVELQGYITKAYGSLTSFNFLFDDEEDRFIGQRTT
jgi:hypothetical protein